MSAGAVGGMLKSHHNAAPRLHLEAPQRLVAFEPRDRLSSAGPSGGASRPPLVYAQDELGATYQVVLKVRNPDSGTHFGPTSLACEMICSVLARALGLPVPDYFIIDIPSGFGALLLPEEPDYAALLTANEGENFGCEYHEGYAIWPLEQPRSVEAQETLESLLVFDTAVGNGDRTYSKPNLLAKGENYLLIDHSLAMMPEWPAHAVPGSDFWLKHCAADALSNKRHAFREPFGAWISGISEEDIERLRSFIPLSWEKSHGDLDKIFDYLTGRPLAFETLSQQIRSVLK